MSKPKPIPVRIVHDEPANPSRYKEPDSMHMSVRKIDNGYIVNEYGWKDGEHYDTSVYSPTKPTLGKPVVARGATRHEPVSRPAPKKPPPPAPAKRATSSKGETTASSFMAVDMQAQPKKASPRSPLNVPSDAGLPRPKASTRNQRLRFAKL